MAGSRTYANNGGEFPDSNDTAAEYPDEASVPQLFTDRAARSPDAVAVLAGGAGSAALTYADLDAWSNRLAWRLADAGTAAGEPVGLYGDRCAQAPAGMLGIMKAGAAYVPLDPADPRLRLLMGELGIRRLVTLPGHEPLAGDAAVFGVMDFRHGTDPGTPGIPAAGGDRAYVLFTSGSTGPPKAVAVPHRAVARLVINTNYVRIGPGDRVANTGHPSFDASVFEIWGALLNGAGLAVVDGPTLLQPAALADFLRKARIDILWLSAGVFHRCARARPAMFSTVRYLITGGDVLIPEIVAGVLRSGPPGHLVNGYGPTENTTFSATYEITELPTGLARIPIGKPIANSVCYLLADDGTLIAGGGEGELAVGGDGVALGYLNSPELTAEKFIPDPFARRAGARLFRTGDRARRLPDGNLDFLGRRDRMIKLRDFRIELDEVEAALSGCPLVGEAAVGVVGSDPLTRTIVAYYTPVPGGGTGAGAKTGAGAATAPGPGTGAGAGMGAGEGLPARLRRYLAGRLPAYMLPGQFTELARFPLSPSGKIDRVALAAAGAAARVAPLDIPETVGPVQAGLARLWEDVLDVPQVGPEDDFFDLGGNSLLAAEVFARLQTVFGVGLGQSRFLTSRLLADASLAACAQAVQEARVLTRSTEGDETHFAREALLDVPVQATRAGTSTVPARSGASPVPAAILLTGGTGFLGSYLLRELLTATSAPVYCLVRAKSTGGAIRRLAAAQARFQLGALPPGRVIPVPGDLAHPLLGLTPRRFDSLASTIGLVLHAAAYVNFTYPYAHLAPVTVGGTREIIKLAARYRGAPIHFVSTLAVLAGYGAAGVAWVAEDTPLAWPEYLHLGYSETKWVAEKLLSHAAEGGLPCAVYRPYEISGELRLGAWNLESATCAMFRAIADTGCAPAVGLPLDFVPVDVLARQMIHIALSRPTQSRTYHLASLQPGTLLDMVERLVANGYAVQSVPLETWISEAARLVCSQPSHPFAPFVPLWVDRSPRSGLTVKEMFFSSRFPRFSTTNTRAALAGAGIAVPPVDAAMLDRYIRFYQRSGFLPSPAGRIR